MGTPNTRSTATVDENRLQQTDRLARFQSATSEAQVPTLSSPIRRATAWRTPRDR